MSYIPPHKRHFPAGSAAHRPTPDQPPNININGPRNCDLYDPARGGSRRSYPTDTGINIVYADSAISLWWWVSAGGRVGPEDLRLERRPCEPLERRCGATNLVLVSAAPADGGGDVEAPADGSGEEQPASIARRMLPDLLASAAKARDMAAATNEVVKLSAAARVGKIFFHESSSSYLQTLTSVGYEANAGFHIRRRFDADVSTQLLEDIERTLVPKAGFEFESEKENYHVKVSDNCRPDLTITCKCVVVNGSLQIQQIELNPVRHLVADVSCLHKDFDLRIILTTKKVLNSLDDAEKDGINGLINAAVIDADMKGGLRWPLGKDAVGERFSIAGALHTRCRTFRSSRMRLKLSNSDRFSYKTSVGEVSNEVTIKLSGIAKHLRGVDVETTSLLEMLQEAIELIWNDLLSFKPSSS